MEVIHEILKTPFLAFLEYAQQNEFMYVLLSLIIAFAVLGQMSLYYKCKMPVISALVPFWNVVVLLKIVGRPWWQSFAFIVPPPVVVYIVLTNDFTLEANIALIASLIFFILFTAIIYIELCNSFGKKSILDYFLILIFNAFYIIYLGTSGDTVYKGSSKNKK